MDETPEDLDQLQQVLSQSIEHAGAFLRASFEMPSHSLSARQLVRYLAGLHTVAFATTTAKGEPRVAPTGALFYRGAFYIPTVASAVRTRQVRQRPGVSLTLYDRNQVAIILHGSAHVLTPDDPVFTHVEELHRQVSGTSVRAWGEGVYLQVVAKAFYTYRRDPAQEVE
jgi:hypothetical protein